LLNALPLYCRRRRLLNALPLYFSRLSSWPWSGPYSSWKGCCLTPLVLLGCGLRVRRRGRLFVLARRSFVVRFFALLGRLRILLFVFLALRVRGRACADHQ
jgi:hypothetical protein